MNKDNIIYMAILIAPALLAGIGGYKLGAYTAKPKEIIIASDSVSLNNYLKLQEQYRELLFSLLNFQEYLEGYERGAYAGYLKAKGIDPEVYKFDEVEK